MEEWREGKAGRHGREKGKIGRKSQAGHDPVRKLVELGAYQSLP